MAFKNFAWLYPVLIFSLNPEPTVDEIHFINSLMNAMKPVNFPITYVSRVNFF